MPVTPAIAASGMSAALTVLGSTAHNIANAGTEGFRREVARYRATDGGGVTVDLGRAPEAGPALERDIVEQFVARNAFLANLAVFRTADAMTGRLLDLRG